MTVMKTLLRIKSPPIASDSTHLVGWTPIREPLVVRVTEDPNYEFPRIPIRDRSRCPVKVYSDSSNRNLVPFAVRYSRLSTARLDGSGARNVGIGEFECDNVRTSL